VELPSPLYAARLVGLRVTLAPRRKPLNVIRQSQNVRVSKETCPRVRDYQKIGEAVLAAEEGL
jgi:hypothetical protein